MQSLVDNRQDQRVGDRQMKIRLVMAGIAVLVGIPAWAADPPLGRLFFTPSQRASLDVARSQRTRATVATEQVDEQVLQPAPQTITYGGMVRRSDGKTTVWLNDRPVDEQKAGGGPTIVRRVGPDGAVTLEIPQSNRSVDLKVGQSVEVLSGSIGEAYRPRPAAGGDETAHKETTGSGVTNSSAGPRVQRGNGQDQPAVPGEAAAPPQPPAASAGSR